MGQTLTERERHVLLHRHGLWGAQPLTLSAVAAPLGVRRERARKLEADAIEKRAAAAADPRRLRIAIAAAGRVWSSGRAT